MQVFQSLNLLLNQGTNSIGGFCYLNNIAIGARYLENVYKLKRICILDIDIHHGNGTQEIFYGNPNVLYISIHRYDNKIIYPRNTKLFQ